MKIEDAYVKLLLTIAVICLIVIAIKSSTKVQATVKFSSALAVATIPTVSAPSKRNPAGFTALPFVTE
jgi:hypothetical protein